MHCLPSRVTGLAGIAAGLPTAQIPRLTFLGLAMAHVRAASTGSDASASEELMSRIKDKSLVKTLGFIGGEWTPAHDGSTYAVSASDQL